jgi:hypothetical protein
MTRPRETQFGADRGAEQGAAEAFIEGEAGQEVGNETPARPAYWSMPMTRP